MENILVRPLFLTKPFNWFLQFCLITTIFCLHEFLNQICIHVLSFKVHYKLAIYLYSKIQDLLTNYLKLANYFYSKKM